MGRPYVPPIEHTCERCGQTFLAFKRDRRRYCGRSCSGISAPHSVGPRNHRYNGGLSTSDGRTIIVCRDYSWIFYSRGLMMAHLGRELCSDEIVHHVNGDCTDDRVENLEVMSRAEHMEVHRAELQAAQWGLA